MKHSGSVLTKDVIYCINILKKYCEAERYGKTD